MLFCEIIIYNTFAFSTWVTARNCLCTLASNWFLQISQVLCLIWLINQCIKFDLVTHTHTQYPITVETDISLHYALRSVKFSYFIEKQALTIYRIHYSHSLKKCVQKSLSFQSIRIGREIEKTKFAKNKNELCFGWFSNLPKMYPFEIEFDWFFIIWERLTSDYSNYMEAISGSRLAVRGG